MRHLQVEHIQVHDGKLDIELAVSLPALHVEPAVAGRVLSLLPNLVRHVCVNGRGDGRFGSELVGTELPHLLEHVVIELQAQACGAAGLMGHTSWAEELARTREQGIARMRTVVSFANDLVALAALKEGCALVEWALSPASAETPDIPQAVARLQSMMELP